MQSVTTGRPPAAPDTYLLLTYVADLGKGTKPPEKVVYRMALFGGKLGIERGLLAGRVGPDRGPSSGTATS